VDDHVGIVGITAFAQERLGEIVYVELPEEGATVRLGKSFGVVESVKAVYDLFAPASGTIEARNERLRDAPEVVNSSPYKEGWMIQVRLADVSELAQLLPAAAYQQLVSGES